MDFTIKNEKENIVSISRLIGYVIIDTIAQIEYNMVRKLALDNYPRFHAYVKVQGSNYLFSLHLDQKQPSYKSKGVHDHNAEYFGPVVDAEVDRIKEILK